MNFTKLKGWVSNQIAVTKRLRTVCIWYPIFLITSVRKHSLTAAVSFSGLQTNRFSSLLKNHPDVAIYQVDQLSKTQARQFSSAIKYLSAGRLPWQVAILLDKVQDQMCWHSCQNRIRTRRYALSEKNNREGVHPSIILPLPPIFSSVLDRMAEMLLEN